MFDLTKQTTADVMIASAAPGFVLCGFTFKPGVKHPTIREVAEVTEANSFPVCAWKVKGDGTVEPLTYLSVDPCDVRFIFGAGKIVELDDPAKPSWPTKEAWTQHILQRWKDRLHIAKQEKAAAPPHAVSLPPNETKVTVPVLGAF